MRRRTEEAALSCMSWCNIFIGDSPVGDTSFPWEAAPPREEQPPVSNDAHNEYRSKVKPWQARVLAAGATRLFMRLGAERKTAGIVRAALDISLQ